jgi:hypothetical protein
MSYLNDLLNMLSGRKPDRIPFIFMGFHLSRSEGGRFLGWPYRRVVMLYACSYNLLPHGKQGVRPFAAMPQ